MKKRILVLFVVAILAVVPAMAASETRGATDEGTWGVGLNLGTNTGVAVKYGYGIFDIYGDLGLNMLSIGSNGFSLGFDVGVDFVVYDVDFGGGHHMPITVGAMVPMAFFFGNSFNMNLGALATAGLQYQIPDVPVSFYLRLGLGLGMNLGSGGFGMNVGWAGSLGVLYVF